MHQGVDVRIGLGHVAFLQRQHVLRRCRRWYSYARDFLSKMFTLAGLKQSPVSFSCCASSTFIIGSIFACKSPFYMEWNVMALNDAFGRWLGFSCFDSHSYRLSALAGASQSPPVSLPASHKVNLRRYHRGVLRYSVPPRANDSFASLLFDRNLQIASPFVCHQSPRSESAVFGRR